MNYLHNTKEEGDGVRYEVFGLAVPPGLSSVRCTNNYRPSAFRITACRRVGSMLWGVSLPRLEAEGLKDQQPPPHPLPTFPASPDFDMRNIRLETPLAKTTGAPAPWFSISGSNRHLFLLTRRPRSPAANVYASVHLKAFFKGVS